MCVYICICVCVCVYIYIYIIYICVYVVVVYIYIYIYIYIDVYHFMRENSLPAPAWSALELFRAVLSPLLFSCTQMTAHLKTLRQALKFADDTTLIGLIQDSDESAYREKIKELAVWWSLNNLELNTLKRVEMLMDFSKNCPALPPLTIMNSTVTAVESFRILGTTISQDLKWDNHIESMVKKVHERLYFLRQLRKFDLPQELLIQFYWILAIYTSITVWFSSVTKSDLRRLWRVVRNAKRIVGTTLPTLQELYLSKLSKRAGKVTLDPSHLAHSLFELLLVDAS